MVICKCGFCFHRINKFLANKIPGNVGGKAAAVGVIGRVCAGVCEWVGGLH